MESNTRFFICLFILLYLFPHPGLQAQVVDFSSSNLPIIIIDTAGRIIPEDERIVASMAIIRNDNNQRNFLNDPANNYNGRIEIELHGQSSLGFPKKSFRIETQDSLGENNNVPLLDMPPENDWILYAPYSDKSLMRNVLVYNLAARINPYAPRVSYCELVLNGDYRGVYVLTERIKRDNNRVDITRMSSEDNSEPEISGGYIFKKDKIDPGDNVIRLDRGLELVVIEPDKDSITPLQITWLRNHLNNLDNTITSAGDYAAYIDVDSFVDNFLLVEFTKNIDGLRLSTYYYKDRMGRIFAGPVWDYNLSLGNADYNDGWTAMGWYYEHITWDNNWVNELIKDADFWQLCTKRWTELRADLLSFPRINESIDQMTNLLQEAAARNFDRFPILGTYVWPNPGYPQSGSYGYISPTSGAPQTWPAEIEYLRDFIQDRIKWMDNAFGVQLFDLTLDIRGKNKGHILYNKRIIDSHSYMGSFSTDTVLALRAEAYPGNRFLYWQEIKESDLKTTWITAGDNWKYLDNGSDQGTTWYQVSFSDSGWPDGNAELGYGDNDESTVVSYGTDANNKYITTYFRKTFNVKNAQSYTTLNLHLLRDDGAVIYLNGTEIIRDNMPDGAINSKIFALEFVDGDNEKSWYTFYPDPQLLTEGKNVVAVEVHQQNLTSSDISFDLVFSGSSENQPGDTSRISSSEYMDYIPGDDVTLQAVFETIPGQKNLVINEIHYNPPQNDLEFIELVNCTDSSLDLSGYYFARGITYTFPPGFLIQPDQYIVLVNDSLGYQDLPYTILQWSAGELADNGELLLLADSDSQVVDSVNFSDAAPWPPGASASGYSIELKNVFYDNSSAHSWQRSYVSSGSPGKPTIRNIEKLYINEFLASNSNYNKDEYGEYDDWIELYNASDQPVDIGGLYLSDDKAETSPWYIRNVSPYTTTIQPDSFLLIWADSDSVQGILHADFQLARSGESITLMQIVVNDTIIIDQIDFAEQQQNISMGRVTDGSENWQFIYRPTPGYSNIITTSLQPMQTDIDKFSLQQNYPNPFNPFTAIEYTLSSHSTGPLHVNLSIYNLLGQQLAILVDRRQNAGHYKVTFDAGSLASGVYIYVLTAGDVFKKSRKFLLIK